MMTNRKRITGRLELGPRGLTLVTESGERWVLDGCEPDDNLIGTEVTAEGGLWLRSPARRLDRRGDTLIILPED